MGLLDLAVGVLEQVAQGSVEDARGAAGQGGGMAALQSLARRLDAHQGYGSVLQEGMEHAHGVGAASHAGDDPVREGAEGVETLGARVSRPITDWKSRTRAG